MVKYQRYACLNKVGPGDLIAPTPPERMHPIFQNGSIGLITAEDPKFNVLDNSGNEGLRKYLERAGLKYSPTIGKYDKPENSFIVHNPTRQQLFDLGKRFGQEAVVYSEGGKHEMIYTNGPHEGKHVPSLPHMDIHSAKPDNYFTAFPDQKGFFTLHFKWPKCTCGANDESCTHCFAKQLLDTPGLPQSSIANPVQHIQPPQQVPQVANPAEKSEVLPMDIAKELKKTLEGVLQKHSSVSPDEVRKATLEMLNERIEAYKDRLVALKKAEGKPPKENINKAQNDCPACGGLGNMLGSFGSREHYRCRDCGIDFSRNTEKKKDPKKDKPTKKDETNPGGGGGDSANIAMSELGTVMAKRELCAGCTNVHSGRCATGMKPKIVKGQVTGKAKKIKKEEFIDRNNEADPEKRLKEAHKPAGVLPGDQKSKVIESDGSGEVSKGKLGKSIFPENKNGGNPLKLGKAAVPMAKPPAGGTGMAPKAPPMSKPAAPKLPGAKPPMSVPAPAMKAEQALFNEKKSGKTDGLEPKNEVTDHQAAVAISKNPAETSPQSNSGAKKAGPISPVFDTSRTSGVASKLFDPKQAPVLKTAKSPNKSQYVAKDEISNAPAKAPGQKGQYLAESEIEKGDFGTHENGKPATSVAPKPQLPGASPANIRGSKLPGKPL